MADQNDRRARQRAVRRRARGGRRRSLGLVVFLALVIAVAVAWWAWWQRPRVARLADRVGVALQGRAAGVEATLFFADPRWTRLVPEGRRIRAGDGPLETVRALVAALAEGPHDRGAPVLPEGARLAGAYLGADGLAVLDFDPGPLEGFDPGGTGGELLTVFAVVQTVTENVEGITSVQILVGGQTRETLSGHVKISEPLVPQPGLLGGESGLVDGKAR